MAGSVNKVTLIGRLGKDPEVVSMNDGNKIVKFSLATSDRWTDRNTNERRERTEWHNIVIFNQHLGNIAEQYLRKGGQAYIEGQLQTRKWQDQDGNDRYTTEIVLQNYRGELTLLGGRGDNDSGSTGDSGGNMPQASAPSSDAPPPAPSGSDLDDDIPF